MSGIKQYSVYWYNGDPGVGSEYQKIRPCIVVSPDELNMHLQTVVIVPLTTNIRPWPFRVTITDTRVHGSVACDQIRVVDKARLVDHITQLDEKSAVLVRDMLRTLYCA